MGEAPGPNDAIDFQKVYDSVLLVFSLLRVTLLYLGLPVAYVPLLLSVSEGPMLFCVGRGHVSGVELRPKSGIRYRPRFLT